MTIDLQSFCANESDPREYLRKPFKVGEWVYATNGHMAVRLPADAIPDIGEVTDHDAKAPKAIGGLFARMLDEAGGKFKPMPTLQKLKKCRPCRGIGRLWAVRCPDCEGEGVFRHGNYMYDCKACDDYDRSTGPGWIGASKGDPGAAHRLCEACNGMGYPTGHSIGGNPPVKFGEAYFNAVYLHRFATLPRVRVWPGVAAADNPDSVMAGFLFDGGHGLLMNIKV